MNEDRKHIPAILQQFERVRLSSSLPRSCPCCQRRLAWGWLDEELASPHDRESDCEEIRIQRIPRPDQTLFCPGCEERILN